MSRDEAISILLILIHPRHACSNAWWMSALDAAGGYRIVREGDLVVRL